MSTSDPRGHGAMAAHFGSRLKYWRRNHSLTQAELARELEVDGSYISKLESSRRHANIEFAKRCDDLLNTGGELVGLLNLIEGERANNNQPAMSLAWAGGAVPYVPRQRDDQQMHLRANSHTPTTLYRLLESYTEIDRSMGGQQISESVERQAQDLIGMHIGESEKLSYALLSLAARFARLAAWIRFDSCDKSGSLFWHDCARRWAEAAHMPGLAVELQARQSLVYSTMGDPAGGLAMAATIDTDVADVNATTWSLIAKAHAHATAGDVDACTTAVDDFDARMAAMETPLVHEPLLADNVFIRHTLVGKSHLHLVLAGADPKVHGAVAAERFRQAAAALSSHHLRDISLTRIRLARSLIALGDLNGARVEITEAETSARRCTSPRVHSLLRRQRLLVDLPDRVAEF